MLLSLLQFDCERIIKKFDHPSKDDGRSDGWIVYNKIVKLVSKIDKLNVELTDPLLG